MSRIGDGMRVVVELKRDVEWQMSFSTSFTGFSPLQSIVSESMPVALTGDGKP